MQRQCVEIEEIIREDTCARFVDTSRNRATGEALNEKGDVGDKQGDRASQKHLFRAVDGCGQACGTPAAEDAWSHQDGDSDWRNTPASRHANETRANDYRDDDAQENGPVGRAKQIKKGETDGAADEGVHDAGFESQERGAEFRLRDVDHRDEGPQRIAVIEVLKNEPHDDAAN